jgi:two-component system, OmpR family, sensor histidine kinase ArlS
MTLRNRISIIISIILTVLFLSSSFLVVYTNFEFRKIEFKKRLEEKALTTVKLLIDVKEVDRKLLKIIDKNTVNKLYDEKTLVFNDSLDLIYSSLDDHQIHWSLSDLNYLKKNHSFFRQNGEDEVFGVYYFSQGKPYYVLISANDLRGKRKMDFLIFVMILTSVGFLISSWLLIRYYVKKGLKPLNLFHKRISQINESNLNTRLEINSEIKSEIDLLASEFNLMLDRIEQAYQKQREFTAQASHELKTPIARIIVQLENLMQELDLENKEIAKKIILNAQNLNELIQSLLLLTKIENQDSSYGENVFVNEILENAIDKICKLYPEYKIQYNIEINDYELDVLSLNCDKTLMEIVFINLLKNAYLYSDLKEVEIFVRNDENRLQVTFENDGPMISQTDIGEIFKPFVRGKNASGKSGLGLGLRIVERILLFYGYSVNYSYDTKNRFTVVF